MNDHESDPNRFEQENARFFQHLGNTLLNSLTGSMAASELLSRRLARDAQTDAMEYLSILRHDQFKLLHIADNLRELAALTLGEITLAREAIDLNQLCTDLVEIVTPLADGVQLSFSPGPEDCLTVGDTGRLERLLLNLIANSLLHCKSGCTIRLAVRHDNLKFYVSVQDDGSGLSSQALESPFGSTPETGQGAGLGLRVAEGIARLHGGSLLLTPRPEGGTEALLTLPQRWETRLGSPALRYGRRNRMALIILSHALSRDKYAPPHL